MNFSSKDKKILAVVGIFILMVSYWKLFLNPQLKSISQLKKDILLNKNSYSLNLEYLERNKNVDSELKILNQRIQDIHKQFPPELNYDEVFVILKNLSVNSGIKIGSFTFKGKSAVNYIKTNDMATGTVDTTGASSTTGTTATSVPAASNLTNAVNSITGELDETGKKIQGFIEQSGLNEGMDVDDGSKEALLPGQGFEVSAQLKSTGKMDQIKKFMKSLESMDNKIKYGDIQMSKGETEDLNFSMTISFLGIYSKNSSGSALTDLGKWNPNEIKNRNNIFDEYEEFPDDNKQSAQSSQIGVSSTSTDTKSVFEKSLDEISKYDFTMRVMPYGNNVAPPTVTLTAKNVLNINDYMYPVIYGDSSGQENVEIYIEENKGRLYFKFKTDNESFPDKQYQSLAEFKPNTNDILILLDSTLRKYKTDISTVSLDIKNNTKRNILVDVVNDDKSQPRVRFENLADNIKVSYK